MSPLRGFGGNDYGEVVPPKETIHLEGKGGDNYTFDVHEGGLLVTQSGASGQQQLKISAADVGSFLIRLLQAVNALDNSVEAPRQHSSYSVEDIREKHPNAYKPWKPEDDVYLLKERAKGRGVAAIAKDMKRLESAVRSRVRKLAGDSLTNP